MQTRVLTNQVAMRVIARLRRGNVRFNQLERDIAAPSPFALSGVLKKLERDGVLTRKVFKVDPPAHVEYALTPLGASLADAEAPLMKWLDTNALHVEAARMRSAAVARA
jgi:DNA-binding HxlR family transcriptional regulator